MDMTQIDIFPWRIYYDKNATQKAYNRINQGDAERCGCDHCLNYIEVRERAYPEKVIESFQELGIDYKKESEVYHIHRTSQGLHNYGGWFLFAGSVECVDSTQISEDKRLTHYVAVDQVFSWSFSNNAGTQLQEVFNDRQLALVYFRVDVPWVIKAKESM